MIELNKNTIEELAALIVPADIGPDKHIENNKPLLGIHLSSPEEIEKYRHKEGDKVVLPEGARRVVACVIDMGELKRGALKATGVDGWEKPNNLDKKYLIYVRDNISYYQAGFSLAHEVGHIIDCLATERTINELFEDGIDKAEKFAERWAIQRIYGLDIPITERINFLTYAEEDYYV